MNILGSVVGWQLRLERAGQDQPAFINSMTASRKRSGCFLRQVVTGVRNPAANPLAA
jgi:hypothetical protein